MQNQSSYYRTGYRTGLLTRAACGLSLLVACSTSPTVSPPPPVPADTEPKAVQTRPLSLSHEAAANRFKQVADTSYTLWFGLDAQGNEFQGRTVVRFDLKPKAREYGSKITLDLEEGTLQSISLNGISLKDISSPERFDGHHLYFNLTEFSPGTNRLEIAYTHPYSTDGNGLHRFKDPADGKVYLYSNFEPYNAHRLFPCFDQPDIKGSYELTVEAPKDWEVISNTLPRETTNVDGRKSWAFPPSAVFSTYVFALHAGPFSVWKADSNGIPIRLFARKSLAQYVDHEEWLKITSQGLDFFGVQFGFPYPFAKYDQIIVPDFNAGAMENVGAVTFSERFVYRTRVTHDRRRGRADVILHEMAHMWFGDLVTMKWWNGLWLNESFATFMASMAVDKATDFKDSWQAFFSGVKQSAYVEDQLVTTHPIELPVPDTDHAQANFDGITYGKGASSLKQLSFFMGEDDFREGLQRYFQKYAYHNTSIADFFKMLSEASSHDLTQWQHVWLQTSGVNTVQAKWECEADMDSRGRNRSRISKLELIQENGNVNGALRPHKTQIALFHFNKSQEKSEKGPLTPKEILPVSYSGPLTSVSEAIGKPCPDFLFPNYGDYDYVKVVLDPVSLKTLSKHLSQVTDAFTRQMVWQSLWYRVIDGILKPQDYADIVLTQGANEKDTLVLSRILRTLVDPSSNRESVLKFLTGELKEGYQKKIEAFVKNHLLHAPSGSDQQLVWYQAFLDATSSESSVRYVRALLTKKLKLPGFGIDQEHRWELIQVLSRNGVKDASELIATELKGDTTDMGLKASIAASALIPDADSKAKWLSQITRNREVASASGVSVADSPSGEETLSPAKLREAMWNYQILGQEASIQASVDSYFKSLPKLALSSAVEDEDYAKWFAGSMFPSLCDPSLVEKTSALLEAYPSLPASIVKSLKINRQKEERCIRARAKSLE